MLLYECQNISFDYMLEKQRFSALRNVSFKVETGDFLCLSGPSGSGKSTLLNLLGLIEPLQQGSMRFQGEEILGLSEEKKNNFRKNNVGFIFQHFHLFDVLSAEENVEYFLARNGVPTAERKIRVEENLRAVGLWEHRSKRPPEMSGGQRQRVAVARAFAKKPSVIIADEPTASLDQATGREIISLMRKLNESSSVSILVASHDPMVFENVKRRINLIDGAIV